MDFFHTKLIKIEDHYIPTAQIRNIKKPGDIPNKQEDNGEN